MQSIPPRYFLGIDAEGRPLVIDRAAHKVMECDTLSAARDKVAELNVPGSDMGLGWRELKQSDRLTWPR